MKKCYNGKGVFTDRTGIDGDINLKRSLKVLYSIHSKSIVLLTTCTYIGHTILWKRTL